MQTGSAGRLLRPKSQSDSQGSLSKTAFHAYLHEKATELSLCGGLLPVRALC